jgi:hypothetical protein
MLNIFKFYGSNKSSDIEISSLVEVTKNKRISSEKVIDLSKINSDSLLLNEFNDVSNFTSNIFSTREGNVFISSIRPNLKKFGISPFNLNILGTIINLNVLNKENIG